MESLPRIRVLKQMGAIEVSEPVRVGGEVRRHPIEYHADPLLVQRIDQEHEVLRRPIARSRREIAGRLIAPRSVEWVLGDGHQFDVREAGLGDGGGVDC